MDVRMKTLASPSKSDYILCFRLDDHELDQEEASAKKTFTFLVLSSQFPNSHAFEMSERRWPKVGNFFLRKGQSRDELTELLKAQSRDELTELLSFPSILETINVTEGVSAVLPAASSSQCSFVVLVFAVPYGLYALLLSRLMLVAHRRDQRLRW